MLDVKAYRLLYKKETYVGCVTGTQSEQYCFIGVGYYCTMFVLYDEYRT